jgi:hypothetical protein
MISGRTVNGTVLTSAAAIVIGGAVLLLNVPALLGAMLGRGAGAHDPSATIARLEAEHRDEMMVHQERFNGRSLFFRPLPPPPAPVPQRERPVAPPAPPVQAPTGPPPPPATYGGPAPMNVLGETVWFRPRNPRELGLRIAVGQEVEGIRVVAVEPPWHVELAWQRGEYRVPIFNRKDSFFATVDDPHRPITGLVVSQEALEQAQKDAAQQEAMSRHEASRRSQARPIPPSAAERARRLEEDGHGFDEPYDPAYDGSGQRGAARPAPIEEKPAPDEPDPDSAKEYAEDPPDEVPPDEPPPDDPPEDTEQQPQGGEESPADDEGNGSDEVPERGSGEEDAGARF